MAMSPPTFGSAAGCCEGEPVIAMRDISSPWGGPGGGQARAVPPSTVRIDPVANGWVRQYR